MSEIIVAGSRPLTIADHKAQINIIQHVLKEVMQNGIHYGTIPGCGDKPALLKPGAEKIMATFRIAADPQVEDLSTTDEARYRVMCRGLTAGGMHLGTGVGECSSNEDKYKWKAVTCQEEWDATPEDRRRLKWKKGREGNYSTQQIRTNPSDVANTVLKMAKKRAQVDMVLTCTAASDIFTQDIDEDDMPRENGNGKPPIQAPQRKPSPQPPQQQPATSSEGEPLISDPQRKRFYAIAKQSGKSDEQIQQHLRDTYGIERTSNITRSIYEACVAWAQAN